jgi:hypothetical protein
VLFPEFEEHNIGGLILKTIVAEGFAGQQGSGIQVFAQPLRWIFFKGTVVRVVKQKPIEINTSHI